MKFWMITLVKLFIIFAFLDIIVLVPAKSAARLYSGAGPITTVVAVVFGTAGASSGL